MSLTSPRTVEQITAPAANVPGDKSYNMAKELIVSINGREKKIAIIENDQVTEFYIERGEDNQGIVGNIYKGRVMRVLPGMQSAFVDVGLERDAFLYVSDFFDEEEEFERIVIDKAKKGEADADALQRSRSPSAAWSANIVSKLLTSVPNHFAKRNNRLRQARQNNQLKVVMPGGDVVGVGAGADARMARTSSRQERSGA